MHYQQPIRIALILLIILCSYHSFAWAAVASRADIEEQNRSARQEDQERRQRMASKDVSLQIRQPSIKVLKLPEETPSFLINSIILDGEKVEKFPWAMDILNQYSGQTIGWQGINMVAKALTEAFIDRGYVTTRVLIPEQDLSSGVLHFTLVPGVIRNIGFQDTKTWGNWQSAFPTRPGDILNMRNLEQGLEQMKRVSSQDVDIQIAPGKKPGESDIFITVKREKPWKMVMSLDDSGTKSTGKLQSTLNFSLDNLFGNNDLFNVSLNSDVAREGQKLGTRGDSIYYSFPYGNSTFTLNSSHYRYHQTVDSNISPFLSSGETDSFDFGIRQLINRDQTQKTHLEFNVMKKKRRSFIEDTEIEVQRQNTTAVKLGISHRQYFGQTTFDALFAFQKGVPCFGARPGLTDFEAGQPTTRYKMWLLDTSLTTPVNIGNLKARYNVNLRAQYTDDLVYGSEFFSIGSRYTVRGFDGEQTLSAERGWFVRNELSFPLEKAKAEIYIGIDCGHVAGPSTKFLLGQNLTGGVLGLRGSLDKLQYDFFVGCPLHKPQGFQTAKTTLGFQLICQF